MNEVKLHKCLNSVGKKCFVTFYREFADLSLSVDELADIIVRDQPNLNRNAAKTWRCSSARKIIEAGRGKDALRIVLDSRLNPDIKEKARRILDPNP